MNENKGLTQDIETEQATQPFRQEQIVMKGVKAASSPLIDEGNALIVARVHTIEL